MKNQGIYLYEADIAKHLYFRKETILSEVGHFHDSPEFIFMISGEIEAHNSKESTIVKEGEIFIAHSFECHYYKKLTPSIQAFVLVLGSEYVSTFKNIYKNKIFPCHLNKVEQNKKMFSLIDNWYMEENKSFVLNIGYSDILFSYMLEVYPLSDKTSNNDNAVLIKILKYVGENFTDQISLHALANEVGYSKEYCSKIFHEGVGLSFRDYVNSLRVKKAKELFSVQKDTKQKTIEIIYDSGFISPATFYRALKKANKIKY